MKQTNIIQRLCLFLLLIVSAMGAWAEKSVLFNSTESGKSKTVTTLTKSPVTIKFDNCKTSGAGNIYELVKGTGLTISVTSGYRIREIVLEDTEGGHDYDNGGLDRIGSYSDASYSMAFVKSAGSQPDNNNIQFRNYDAPAQSFRIVGHNMSNKGQLKIRRITVVYVSEGNIRFTIPSKTIHVGEEWRFAYGSITASTSGFTNSEITHSVGNNEIATCKSINGGSTYALKGLKVGETTLNVKARANDNYSSTYASIPIYVVRNDLNPSLSWTSKTMKAWETIYGPTLRDMPTDYQPTWDQCTFSSSDESVVKPTGYSPELIFGGSGYGKTATITITIPQTNKYNEKKLTYTVTVDNEMRIASKADWQAFANQVDAGNTSINATMTADVDLQTDVIKVGNANHPFTGTFDGGGHTLSLNWDIKYYETAPFLHTSGGATIKNLHTKGQITTGTNGTSGLIDRVVGKTTISGCISEVDITSSYANGTCGASGLVFVNQYQKGDLTITDCIVKGTFNGTTEKGSRGMSGFVFNQNAVCTISNSLYLGSNNGGDWSDTFAKYATITNCYYLNPCGTAQGTQVTEKQLKNGYVTKLLQADRTDACYWAQQLGEMPSLYSEADKGKDNYVYYDAENSKWACGCYKFSESSEQSIGIDFTATQMEDDRTFPVSSSHGYTWCLPFEQPIQGFSAYTLSGCDGSTLQFKEVTGKLEAYRPYYIVLSGLATRGGNDIEVKAFNTDALTSAIGDYCFVGTVDGMDNAEAAAARAYILQSDGLFHKVTTDNTAAVIPPYRAYLTIADGSTASKAKALSISLGGETTGIRAIETTDQDGTVRYYDLQGRYIGNTLDGQPKGIYIKNGKKFINK